MKKIMLFISLLLISLLSSCSFLRPKSISEIYDVISKSDNYKVTAIFDVSFVVANYVAEIDTDNVHFKGTAGLLGIGGTEEYYLSVEDGDTYKYTVRDDGYIEKEKCLKTIEEESDVDTSWLVLFDEKCYTFNHSDTTYYMRDDMPIIDDDGNMFFDAKIRIGENEEYYTISFTTINSGMSVRCRIVISDIGKISIVLPDID